MVRIKDLLGTAVYTEDEDMVNETTDQLAKQMQNAFEKIAEIDRFRSRKVKDLQEAFNNYYKIARSVTLGLINGDIPEEKRQEASLKMINAMNDFEKRMREYRKIEYDSFTSMVDGTIDAFKKEQCRFFGMSDIVLGAYEKFKDVKAKNIEEIIQIDTEVRKYVNQG